MIDNGEIPLKNKEERAVFADPLQFQKEMRSTCSQLAAHEEACRRVAEEIAVHPAIAKRGSLERERAQLVSMLEKEKAQLADLALFKEKTRDRIPALTEDLRKKTGAIMGKNVQVQDRGTGPV
jgi:hypothetical protein